MKNHAKLLLSLFKAFIKTMLYQLSYKASADLFDIYSLDCIHCHSTIHFYGVLTLLSGWEFKQCLDQSVEMEEASEGELMGERSSGAIEVYQR